MPGIMTAEPQLPQTSPSGAGARNPPKPPTRNATQDPKQPRTVHLLKDLSGARCGLKLGRNNLTTLRTSTNPAQVTCERCIALLAGKRPSQMRPKRP